jgi:site-specific DNA-methyltransferase (adenine-specific)
MKAHIITGNNIDVLKTYPDNHFDSVVTDPPYGIDFLGKEWDVNTGALETYQECLRVLKPGGYLLAFSAARTYHHLAVTVEQAGFEIRDQIMWIYSSGFPKSQDIGKSIQRSLGVEQTQPHKNNAPRIGGVEQGEEIASKEQIVCTDPEAIKWEGWGTQLKPAHEPIVMARKPLHKSNSIAKNCQQWGVGAVNIDAGRVPYETNDALAGLTITSDANATTYKNFSAEERTNKDKPAAGRRTSSFHNATGGGETHSGGDGSGGWTANDTGRFPSNVIGEILQADYQKYFYCPKVSRAERHIGHELPAAEPLNSPDQVRNHPLWDPSIGTNAHRLKEKIKAAQGVTTGNVGNNHPTVKPIELMKYLIKLITPPGGHVLDPFNGSGSTGCAAVELDFEYTGIELDPAYVAIAQKRIEAWYDQTHTTTFGQLFE